jgi:hypothetical protein
MRYFFCLLAFVFFSVTAANSQATPEAPPQSPEVLTPDTEPKHKVDENTGMTLEAMVAIVQAIDEEAEVRGSAMQLTISDVKVTVITDSKNNRMRAFVPIQSLDGVNQQLLYRMLQANFDSALDARYAIAKEHILSVFIHPLKELKKDQFIEGLGQVVNLVKTYGTAFTSGGMTFGGGDSRNLHRKLIDELLKKGEQI